MKQFLLLLSLVGAAIYAFLVITHNVIPDHNAEEPDHLAGQRLSAWGPYLPRRSSSQQPQATLATSQQSAPYGPRPYSENRNQDLERNPGAEYRLASSQDKEPAFESAGTLSEPAPAKPALQKSKKPSRSAKPAFRVSRYAKPAVRVSRSAKPAFRVSRYAKPAFRVFRYPRPAVAVARWDPWNLR